MRRAEQSWWRVLLLGATMIGWLAAVVSLAPAQQVEPVEVEVEKTELEKIEPPRVERRPALRAGIAAEPLPAADAEPPSPPTGRVLPATSEPTELVREEAGGVAVEVIEPAQIEEWQKKYEAEQKALIDRLRADPQWKPTHEETAVIHAGEGAARGALHNFCLDRQGNVMACVGGTRFEYVETEGGLGMEMKTIEESSEIRIFSPQGELLRTWKLDFKPEAICQLADGTTFVAGDGTIAKLSAAGEVLAKAESPAVAEPDDVADDEDEDDEEDEDENGKDEEEDADDKDEQKQSKSVLQALIEALGGPSQEETAQEMSEQEQEWMRQRRREVTGVAATDRDVFVATAMREGYGYAVWRMDHELTNPEQIVEGLRGCCGQMDIQAHDGNLWVAENGRHRAICYDREGKEVSQFGKRDRKSPEGFGGCCEPKNLRFDAEGMLYTAESGPPNVVKRFTAEGEYLGVAALADFHGGCVRTTVEVSRDGRDIYVLDTTCDGIRVFTDTRAIPTHVQAGTIDVPKETPSSQLHTFCVDPKGRILAACGGERMSYTRTPEGTQVETTFEPAGIHVLDGDGKLLTTWKLEMTPQAVNVAPDGTVFVGGQGKLAKLSPEGKVLLTADAPNMADLPPLPEIPEETEEDKAAAEEREKKAAELREKQQPLMQAVVEAQKAMRDAAGDAEAMKEAQAKYQKAIQEYIAVMQEAQSASLSPREAAIRERAAALRKRKVNAIAATKQDVFVCCPAIEGYGYDVYRTDHELKNPEKIVEGLRGCCGQMDVQAGPDGDLFVAENARDRVVHYDREGNLIAAWGKSDRNKLECFGSCCNPMNVRFGPDRVLYTSEASLGRIKRYAPDGEFLGLVGISEIVPGCKHVAIGMNADASRVYMLDITRSQIVVLKEKPAEVASVDEEPAEEQTDTEAKAGAQ
jgi:sugar lactone lactonase YvrE